jgi:hypothetical protein
MGELFRRGAVSFVAGIVGASLAATLAWSSVAQAQSEPPGRVGRLAFTDGTVSFHDNEQSQWTPAVVNTPLTTGDSLWTEPTARSEISLAGTRIRMAGATELDMLAIDDTQTRLQVDQGRIDVKTLAMDTSQPYQITTPRGTISLQQQGDYYVEAGSTEDPTRLGVRSGAAQIQGLDGQVLAVRAGEVGEVTGDAATPQLRTIRTAPPTLPGAWADRDRQVIYDQSPQYLSSGVTGYEDLNNYGTWVSDSSYGEVWIPRSVPAGWAPYRTGHWAYVQPWGWTWIDEQPWGFAPYHYGRWANSGGRWMWLPPQREARPVYAPALVAFVGGIELVATLSRQSNEPVGWFPLGPREAYVPSYTTNRDYYQRINRPAQVQDQVLNDRWQRAERREPAPAGQNAALANQRFATVVPATAFVRSQPVMRAALQVAPARIAAAPVAPVAAPPAPTASIAVAAPATAPTRTLAPNTTPPNAAAPSPAPAGPKTQAPAKAAAPDVPVAKTAVADMPTLAKPAASQAPTAPGPKFAATRPTAPTTDTAKPAVPALTPRQGAAPPELKGAVAPAPAQPAKPGEPPRQQQAAPQPQAAPAAGPKPEPPKPAEPPKPQQAAPQQAAPQPHAAPQAAPAPQQQAKPEPAEPPRPQQAAPQPPAVPHPAPAAPAPQQQTPQQQTKPEPPRPAEPPRQQQAAPQPPQHPQPQPQPQAPKPPEQAQAPHPAPPQAQPAAQPQAHPAPPAPALQQKKDEEKK